MIDAIEKTLHLDAAIDDVWRALTDPAELSGWFGDTTELNPQVGGRGWFGWEAHGKFAVEVREFDPPRRFAWRWSHEAGKSIDETHTTLVEWTLEPRADGGTTLHLRESGFATAEHRRENVSGWDQELGELVEHLAAA